jgi:two-component system, NtrC family, sensor kinase
MRLVRDMPIERKMTLIAMLTTWLALLVCCGAFVTYELVVFRIAEMDELSTIGALTADGATAALSFADVEAAQANLRSLAAQPEIVGAAVYDRQGKLFATFRSAARDEPFAPPAIGPDGLRFADDRLRMFRGVVLDGERLGTLYIEHSLDEMRARLVRYALIVALVMAGASLTAYLLVVRLRQAVCRPISHLAGVMSVVAAEGDYRARAVKQGEDELGRLIDGFNDMLAQIQAQDQALHEARLHLELRVVERTAELESEIAERVRAEEELEEIHKQLLLASRLGGMAEIATNVLHNVGNVLNSVNVSAALVAESLKKSKVSGLSRAVALLQEHEHELAAFLASDPRGRNLPVYLAELATHLGSEQRATIGELDSLRANIEHIKEIVAMQQSYAKVSGVKEMVNIVELVEDSVRMNVGALSRHGVELERDYSTVPMLNLEKHKVLQILVNLVRNAKYACDESGRADKRLTLRVTNGHGRVRVSVIDNGVGIPPENITRIFNHGFTTRQLGHGFGLHSGALAAKELGGSLSVLSDGVGRGATFHLDLPLQPAGASV